MLAGWYQRWSLYRDEWLSTQLFWNAGMETNKTKSWRFWNWKLCDMVVLSLVFSTLFSCFLPFFCIWNLGGGAHRNITLLFWKHDEVLLWVRYMAHVLARNMSHWSCCLQRSMMEPIVSCWLFSYDCLFYSFFLESGCASNICHLHARNKTWQIPIPWLWQTCLGGWWFQVKDNSTLV